MIKLPIEGRWWLPGRSDKAVSGTLFKEGGGHIKLRLNGRFQNVSAGLLKSEEPATEIIHGDTRDGQIITLIECRMDGWHASIYTAEDYSARMAFVGWHFKDREEMIFNKAWITYDRAIDWFCMPCFSLSHQEEERQIVATCKIPPSIKVNVERGAISFDFMVPTNINPHLRTTMECKPYLEIETSEKLTAYEWESAFIRPLRDWFTFALRHVTKLTEVSFSCDGICDSNGDPQAIEIILPKETSPEPERRILYPHEVILNYYDISQNFEKIIARWFVIHRELDNVMTLFFSPIYNEHLYLGHQFLDCSYALESYHRSRRVGSAKPEEYFEDLKRRLLDKLQGHEKRWLENKLKYANEKFLKDRILELLTDLRKWQDIHPWADKDLAERVAQTRNYYVHPDKDERKQPAKDEALFRIIQILQVTIEAIILFELGLEDKQISDILTRNGDIQFMKRYLLGHKGLLGGSQPDVD